MTATDPSTVPAPLTKAEREEISVGAKALLAKANEFTARGKKLDVVSEEMVFMALANRRYESDLASLEARCEESDSQDLLALKQRKVFCSTDGFWRSLHSADIYNSADEALTARRDYLARASRSQPVPNDG